MLKTSVEGKVMYEVWNPQVSIWNWAPCTPNVTQIEEIMRLRGSWQKVLIWITTSATSCHRVICYARLCCDGCAFSACLKIPTVHRILSELIHPTGRQVFLNDHSVIWGFNIVGMEDWIVSSNLNKRHRSMIIASSQFPIKLCVLASWKPGPAKK